MPLGIQQVQLGVADVERVHEQHPHRCVEGAGAADPLQRRAIEASPAPLDLLEGLGDVDVDRQLQLGGRPGHEDPERVPDGVGRVRPEGGDDPLAGQRLVPGDGDGGSELLFPALATGPEAVLQGRRYHPGQPGIGQGVGDRAPGVVVLPDHRRARQQALPGPDPRERPHVGRREALFQAVVEIFDDVAVSLGTAAEPAERRHRQVGVGVDEGRGEQAVAQVDRVSGAVGPVAAAHPADRAVVEHLHAGGLHNGPAREDDLVGVEAYRQ